MRSKINLFLSSTAVCLKFLSDHPGLQSSGDSACSDGCISRWFSDFRTRETLVLTGILLKKDPSFCKEGFTLLHHRSFLAKRKVSQTNVLLISTDKFKIPTSDRPLPSGHLTPNTRIYPIVLIFNVKKITTFIAILIVYCM